MDILIDYAHRESDIKPIPVHDLAQFVIAKEDMPFTTEVSISFVNNDTIAQLNKQYRNIDAPTDVLSFECDTVDDDVSAMLLTQEQTFQLGDVIIAPDVAEKQSAEYGTTFEDEIELLLVHGLLHLCGYDHLQDDEAETMEARERELLAQFAKEAS